MRPRIPPALLLVALAAAPAAGQATGYDAPGSLGEKQLSPREIVTRSYQDARWQVGFLHLDPQLSIGELGYVSNVYSSAEGETESDFKARGSAGLRGFFNLGSKVLVSPFANLSHTWWQDQRELRATNESFGLQLFGDFNRLQLGLQSGRVEKQSNLSSELEVPVNIQTDRIQLDLEIDFWGPFRFFASAVDGRNRHAGKAAEERLPGLELSLLDVDTERLEAGVAYELGNGLSLGLGWSETESTFRNDSAGRTNQGSGPLLQVGFEGVRIAVQVELAQRDIEFEGRAAGDKRQQESGLGRLGFELSERLRATFYAGTRLNASALDGAAIFESRRTGISLERQGSPRTRVGAFYEVGEDEFATVTSDRVNRIDDFTSYGINLATQVGKRLTIEVGFLDSRRDSSDPQFDRNLSAVTSQVRLGGNLLPW